MRTSDLVMAILAFSTPAFGVTCEIKCNMSVTELLDTIERTAPAIDQTDFRANCTEFLGGSVTSCRSDVDREYVPCTKTTYTSEYISGSGSDLAEARRNARENCQEEVSSGSDVCRSGAVPVGEFRCSN